MSPAFDPQTLSYTVTVDDTDDNEGSNPFNVKFSWTPRDGQSVSYALDESSDAGAQLIHKGGATNYVVSLKLTDGTTVSGSKRSGTAIVKFTVTETGTSEPAKVYTFTVNYTIWAEVEVDIGD